jgi:hypothetical protein
MRKLFISLLLALSLIIPQGVWAKDYYANIDGKIDDLMQVVYDSGELASAATSVTISNLDGDVDEEYQLIARIVNNYNGANDYTLTFNTDTGSNYGRQYLLGTNTTVAANRAVVAGLKLSSSSALNSVSISETILKVKSGYVRIGITKGASGIVTTTVTSVEITGQVWNNAVDNATSFVITASGGNGLGIGSRIILLRKVNATTGKKYYADMNIKGLVKNAWQEVTRETLTGTVSSVTISNLTGNTDVLYRLRARLVSAGNAGFGLRLNGDSGSNYGQQFLNALNATASAARYVGYTLWYGPLMTSYTTSGHIEQEEFIIYAKSGYVRTAIWSGFGEINGTTVTEGGLCGGGWNNTADEITSMVINFGPDCGGAGTFYVLEKLNLN